MRFRLVVLVLAALPLASCNGLGMNTDTSVEPVAGAAPPAAAQRPTDPKSIIVTQNDITDRRYRSLGDINVTVSKSTVMDRDPTRADIDEALRASAATLGADAVVLVRYGTVGMGLLTWGKLDGNGRAVAFEK